jgi:DNA polymerase III epsilon subunit-like protein
MAVNGITDDMVLEAPTFDQIVDDVLKFINDAVIVAHNAPFDLNFFAYQFRNLGVPPLDNFVIDTLYLARAYYNFPSNSLPKVAAYMGISTQKFHRALQDSFTTKLIFDNFLRDFRRQGVNCLEDLLELQGGTVPFPQLPEIVLPPAIDEAVRGSKKLQISYVSAENVRTVRVVEPREVNAFGDNIYLVAFCHLRKEERVFRLDRIIEMKEVR